MVKLPSAIGRTLRGAFMICAILLGGCRQSEAAPPSIDAAALHRAEQVDMTNRHLRHLDAHCIVHYPSAGLSRRAVGYDVSRRIKLTFGFDRLAHWEKPDAEDALVEPALEAELRRASTQVILDSPAKEATDVPSPKGCWTSYLLSAPSYAGRIAFLDRAYRCDLCGSGATLAMKYDGKEWQLVAIHGSWVS